MQAPSKVDWSDVSTEFKMVLRIRYYPSFEPMTVWDVGLRTNASQGPFASVFELTWDRPSDARRFTDPLAGVAHPLKLRPVPSLYGRQTTFDAAHFLRQLEQIDFRSFDPDIHKDRLYLDGDHFYVEAKPDLDVLTFHWEANTGPREWVELILWTQQVTELLRAQLTETGAQTVAIQD